MGDLADDDPAGELEPALAELAEQITRQLQAGEPVDPEEFIRLHPSCAGPIRRLLPTLQTMVSLGRTAARNRRRRSKL